ncbi:MAG: hypothetical protein ACM3TT_12290, partial [Syntrophothermus sp.]
TVIPYGLNRLRKQDFLADIRQKSTQKASFSRHIAGFDSFSSAGDPIIYHTCSRLSSHFSQAVFPYAYR